MKMRIVLMAVPLLWVPGCQPAPPVQTGRVIAPTPAGRPAPAAAPGAEAFDLSPAECLRRASRDAIAIEGEDARLYGQDLLMRIAAAQERAGDLEGAALTVRALRPEDRERAMINLAAAQAAAGDEAGMAGSLAALGDSAPQYAIDNIRKNLATAQAQAGKFPAALATADRISRPEVQAEAAIAIALAMAKAGDRAAGQKQFDRALQFAEQCGREFDTARAMVSVYRAQQQAGDPRAPATLDRLAAKLPAMKDAWSRAWGELRLAEIQWAAGDRKAAEAAYGRAREAVGKVDHLNTQNAFQQIAISRVRAGDLAGAAGAVEQIPVDREDSADPARPEEAWGQIAQAQTATGDLDAALKSARRIEHFTQYRGDALMQIVPALARQGRLKEALAAAEECDSPSRKARAVLEVAIVQALAGDKAAARETAAATDSLRPAFVVNGLLPGGDEFRFSYRDPRTWTRRYDFAGFLTMCTAMAMEEHARELAVAAMRLAVALGDVDPQACAAAFDGLGVFDGPIVQAMARAQAAAGDPAGAKRWIEPLTKPYIRANAWLGLAAALSGEPADAE